MLKRFTDTEKWDDPWYRRLSVKHKALWQYLCDNCDNAGVWKADYEIASFYIGEQISQEDMEVLNKDKERVILINCQYVLIKDFIFFQIGNIFSKDLTNLQKSCNSLISKYLSKGVDIVALTNLTGSLPVAIRYKHKGKGKGKERVVKGKQTDERFIKTLKENASYAHINIDQELGKMDGWLLTRPDRKKTKRFIVAWLNRIDKPLEIKKSEHKVYKAPDPKGKFKFVPPKEDIVKLTKGNL